jgi:hypothetical protein
MLESLRELDFDCVLFFCLNMQSIKSSFQHLNAMFSFHQKKRKVDIELKITM